MMLNTNSEMAGMFERSGRTLDPAGMMWSVVMLSTTFNKTGASIFSAKGELTGKGLMFGPRTTSTFLGSLAGGIIPLSSHTNFSGISILGILPRVEGSVILPVKAQATQVSGEAK